MAAALYPALPPKVLDALVRVLVSEPDADGASSCDPRVVAKVSDLWARASGSKDPLPAPRSPRAVQLVLGALAAYAAADADATAPDPAVYAPLIAKVAALGPDPSARVAAALASDAAALAAVSPPPVLWPSLLAVMARLSPSDVQVSLLGVWDSDGLVACPLCDPVAHAPVGPFYALAVALLGRDMDTAAELASAAAHWLGDRNNLTSGVDLKFVMTTLTKVLKVLSMALDPIKSSGCPALLEGLERVLGFGAKLESKLKIKDPRFARVLPARVDLLLAAAAAAAAAAADGNDEPSGQDAGDAALARAAALIRDAGQLPMLRSVAATYAKRGAAVFADGDYKRAHGLLISASELMEQALAGSDLSLYAAPPSVAHSLAHVYFLLAHTSRKGTTAEDARAHACTAVALKASALFDPEEQTLAQDLPDNMVAIWGATAPDPADVSQLADVLPAEFVDSKPSSLVTSVVRSLAPVRGDLWECLLGILTDGGDSGVHLALDKAQAKVYNDPNGAVSSVLDAVAAHPTQPGAAEALSWVGLWVVQFSLDAQEWAGQLDDIRAGMDGPDSPANDRLSPSNILELAVSAWTTAVGESGDGACRADGAHAPPRQTLLHIADMYGFLGRPHEQMVVLNAAMNTKSGHPQAAAGLAAAYNVLGDPAAALDTLASAALPGGEAANTRAAVARSLALAALGDVQESTDELEDVDDALAAGARAALALKVGEGDRALEHASTALQATARMVRRVDDPAADLAGSTLVSLPYDILANVADTLYRLGMLYAARSALRKAAYYFSKGIAVAERVAAPAVELRFRLELVSLYTTKHDFAKAHRELDAARALGSRVSSSGWHDVELALGLRDANLAAAERRWTDADAAYSAVLDRLRAPNGPPQLSGLVLEDTVIALRKNFGVHVERLRWAAQVDAVGSVGTAAAEASEAVAAGLDDALPVDAAWIRVLAATAQLDDAALDAVRKAWTVSKTTRSRSRRKVSSLIEQVGQELDQCGDAVLGCGDAVLFRRWALWLAWLAPARGVADAETLALLGQAMSPSVVPGAVKHGADKASSVPGCDVLTLAVAPDASMVLMTRSGGSSRRRTSLIHGVDVRDASGERVDSAKVFGYQRATRETLDAAYSGDALVPDVAVFEDASNGASPLSLKTVMETFGHIMLVSRATTSGAVDVSTRAEKAKWWETRIGLDEVLGTMLSAVEAAWLPPKAVVEPKTGPLVLVLDHNLGHFPWEAIPSLSPIPCTRVPNMQFCESRGGSSSSSGGGGGDKSGAFYVLNPSGDLVGTQERFETGFSGQTGWRGVAGRAPSVDEMVEGLRRAEMFVYCGHGGGEAFLSMERIQGLGGSAPPTTLLLGCSSGLLRWRGEHAPVGIAVSYLVGGSQRVVSNLWDVTDGDLDRLSARLLLEIEDGKTVEAGLVDARTECKLQWLVGAASVCYGGHYSG